MVNLFTLNGLDKASFVATLGAIFEESPQIAADVWFQRPFSSLDDLHRQMCAIVDAWEPAQQLALIQAHPDLGGRMAMAAASVAEQSGLGLNQLSETEFVQFQALNQTYRQRFGFPYIVAVRNHTKATILADYQTRIAQDPSTERQRALQEIYQIARFRLQDVIES